MPKKERLGQELPDLTEFDFDSASLYMSKPDAMSLRCEKLKKDRVILRSWGKQEMVVGDWITYRIGSDGATKESGVRKEAFLATYDKTNEKGYYVKRSFIKAMKISHDYCFLGVDSDEPETAPAGSYIVLNLDKSKDPIMVGGRRDVYFYVEEDLLGRYVLVDI